MVCVTKCAFVILCVITVNKSSTILNMTLTIYDIKLDGHGPRAAKCSVSWSNPVVLNLGTNTLRGQKDQFGGLQNIYETILPTKVAQ